MRKILIAIITTPLIYLTIALVLLFIPVQRITPEHTLNFDVLKKQLQPVGVANERNYVARDKAKLFYRYMGGDSDISVILLHGSGTDGKYLIPLANTLNLALDISVIIPDLRGHGRSQGGHSGDIQYIGQFEHDLEDLRNHLILSNPRQTIILGGHSSGGGLALKYGGNDLAQFNGTILLAPYLGYQAPTVRPNSGGWVQVTKLRYAGLAMLNNVGITFFNVQPVLFFNRPVGITDSLQLESYSYRLNESLSPQAYQTDLSNNKLPMLLLVGAEDEAFYPQEFQAIMTSYAPHADFHILDNVKHLDLPSNEKTSTLILKWFENSFSKYNRINAVLR